MERKLDLLETKLNNLTNELNGGSFQNYLSDFIKSHIDEWLSDTLTVSCIKEEIERRYKRNRSELLDFVKTSNNTQHEVRELQHKFKVCFEDIQRLRVSIDDVSNDLKYRAYQSDLFKVEKELHTMCPLSYAQQLAAELRTMATAEELIKTQNNIKVTTAEMYSTFLDKNELKKEMARVQNLVNELFYGYAKTEKVNEINEALSERCNAIELTNKKISEQLEKSAANLKQLIYENSQELSTKVKREEMDEVLKELSYKATIAEFCKLQSETYPRLTNFAVDLEKFNRIQQEQETALGRLDEIILQKASKVDVRDLTSKVKSITKHIDLEQKIDDLLEKIKWITYQDEERDKGVKKLQGQLNEIWDFYTKKRNDADDRKMIKDQIVEINSTLLYKIDKDEVARSLEEKATVDSVKSLSVSIESVHKQMKLLAVQLGAIQKTFTSSNNDKGSTRSKRDHFYKITQRLVEYIVRSQPIADKSVGEEFKSFLRLPETIKITSPEPMRTLTPNNRLLTPHRKIYYSFENPV